MSIQPYFLFNNKECDFCNTTQKPLLNKILSFNFGFTSCRKCNKKSEEKIIDWIKKNKKVSWIFLLNILEYTFDDEETYVVKRTNQITEKDWYINVHNWITYSNFYQDFLLPMVKYDKKGKFLFKKITLTEFCKYNKNFNFEQCNTILFNFLMNL